NEKDIVKLKEGMKATITSNALPDQEVSGEITQVINFASADTQTTSTDDMGTSSGASYSANINIDPGSSLLLGMSVKVNIMISNEGSSLAVPYDSIGEDENGETYVFRGNDNGDGTYTIEKVAVTKGASNDYYTAIEGDVAEGDYIVLYPYMVEEGSSTELSIVDGTTDLTYESEDETEEW
nr:efflux RND transporter periplasmic adaptor subunit [Lachnospiraceae bacterium]